MAQTFEVTENHIKLLGRLYIDWYNYAYNGAPGVDPKRPFGNSDVDGDIYQIINDVQVLPEEAEEDEFWQERREEYDKLFRDMEFVVQITTYLAGQGELIEPGVYFRPDMYNRRVWTRLRSKE